MNHHDTHHGTGGSITTILLATLGGVLKMIEGIEALQVLAYTSYIVAIVVGLLTIREKWPYPWPAKWFKK